MLHLSEDVELNLESNVAEKLTAIINDQRALLANINSIKEKLDKHNAESNEQLVAIECKKKSSSIAIEKLTRCESVVTKLQEDVLNLTGKVDYL